MLLSGRRTLHPCDIQFDGRWVQVGPALRWAWIGMPRIPDAILKSTFYLYDDAASAEAAINPRGTGFLVARPFEHDGTRGVIYAVTNWHVACRGASVVRLMGRDGKPRVFDLAPHDWVFRPKWHDIAITPLLLNFQEIDCVCIRNTDLLTDEKVAEYNIGTGEDVFMVGLFVDAAGHETRTPAVRFGNISMMPIPLPNNNNGTVPTYCIDVHSRTGFSGSPVWVYRRAGQNLTSQNLNMGDQFLAVLGIHYAQFPERWEIHNGPQPDSVGSPEEAAGIDQQYIRGMSGMTKVVPAQAITELLDHPRLRGHFDSYKPNDGDVDPVGDELA